MTCPAAPVIVISVPEISMGLKPLFEVLPNVVLPANVTVEPCLSFVRRIVELAGAEMLSRTMLVQDATADVIWAYSVQVQVVPPPPAAVVVVVAAAVVDLTDEVVVALTLDVVVF
jgi:hypothetical protein